jgi:hypothetical protein
MYFSYLLPATCYPALHPLPVSQPGSRSSGSIHILYVLYVLTRDKQHVVQILQSHFILSMSHWSSGLPVSFSSWGIQVQTPGGYLYKTGILMLAISSYDVDNLHIQYMFNCATLVLRRCIHCNVQCCYIMLLCTRHGFKLHMIITFVINKWRTFLMAGCLDI